MKRVDETKTMMVQTGKKASNVKHFKWILPASMAVVAGGVPLGFGIYALANPTASSDSKLILQLKEFDQSIADEFVMKNINGENYWMPNAEYIKYITLGDDPADPNTLKYFQEKYPMFHNVIEPGTFELIVDPGGNSETYRINDNTSTSKGLLGLGWNHKVSDFFEVDLPNYLQSVSIAHPLPPKDPDISGKPIPVDTSLYNTNAQPDYTGQPQELNIVLYNPIREQQLISQLESSEPQFPSEAEKNAAALNEPRREQFTENFDAADSAFKISHPEPTRANSTQKWIDTGHPRPTRNTAEARVIASGDIRPTFTTPLPTYDGVRVYSEEQFFNSFNNPFVTNHIPLNTHITKIQSTSNPLDSEIVVDHNGRLAENTHDSYIWFLEHFSDKPDGVIVHEVQSYGLALESYERDLVAWNARVNTQLQTDIGIWNTEIETQYQSDLSAYNTAKSNWELNEKATAIAADQHEYDLAHDSWQEAKRLAEEKFTDAVDEYNTLHPQWVRDLLSAKMDWANKQAIYDRDYALVQERNAQIASFRHTAEEEARKIRESETLRLQRDRAAYEVSWAAWLSTTSAMTRAYYAVIGDQINEVMFGKNSPFANNKTLYSELVYLGNDAIFPESLETDVHTAYLAAIGGDSITPMELDEFLNKYFADTFGVMDMVNGNPNMTFLEVPYVVGITDFSKISFEYKLAEAIDENGIPNVNSELIIPGALVGNERYRSHILANDDVSYNEAYYEDKAKAEGGI